MDVISKDAGASQQHGATGSTVSTSPSTSPDLRPQMRRYKAPNVQPLEAEAGYARSALPVVMKLPYTGGQSQTYTESHNTLQPQTHTNKFILRNSDKEEPSSTWPSSKSSNVLPISHRRLYTNTGPVCFSTPPVCGGVSAHGEVRPWHNPAEAIISQNASKRKVYKALWLSPTDPTCVYPSALKFVHDNNARDGRSIKREIECHLYIYQKLGQLMKDDVFNLANRNPQYKLEDAWPCSELLGYHLDKKNPGTSVLITRKLSGPDFFDIIRTEHHGVTKNAFSYDFHKLQWCTLALKRVAQYGSLGIRHNDIKPDNIVLDLYQPTGTCVSGGGVGRQSASSSLNERILDVKIIDLGTASMHSAKDFTGGTSWYESPEQKLLEYYTKKQKNPEAAKRVDIGLQSDAWGAGVSMAEVLIGRRIADALKEPKGPGPLEYSEGSRWVVDPDEWAQTARLGLGLHKDTHWLPICKEAAGYVFDSLVISDPKHRAPLRDVINKMEAFTEEAKNRLRHNGSFTTKHKDKRTVKSKHMQHTQRTLA